MPPPQIVSLDASHVDAAARVLALQQARLRQLRPELPDAFTHVDATRPLVEAQLTATGAHGVAAFDGSQMVAFLIGAPRYEPIWNRAAWSPIEGQAIDPDADRDILRDVYAVWSQHWVDRGIFFHYVHAPADDRAAQDAWIDLNFGRMQAHALLALDAVPAADADAFEIRRMATGEADLIGRLKPLIPVHQTTTPTYAITLPERFEAMDADYAEDLADPDSHYWVALDAGAAVGIAAFYPMPPGIMVPEGAWELGVAMTDPGARGRGVQRALLAAGAEEIRATGATHIVTDWRTANLLSSRSWTKLGFRPTHHRMHRAVDQRVAWAARPA
jgi:ribosomal protein S18 acetylase RimI-like enzyme